jgi:hypothetical protein
MVSLCNIYSIRLHQTEMLKRLPLSGIMADNYCALSGYLNRTARIRACSSPSTLPL